MNRHARNKISTPSYFIKRLKDSKFTTFKVFGNYSDLDPRKWTILVDPGGASVFVTCYENKVQNKEVLFEFNDGGQLFPKNFSLKTESIEIVVTNLINAGVQQRLSYEQINTQ
jgi:hypothetical protein